jgi:hypothetical protein
MLNLVNQSARGPKGAYSRRSFLQAGALALGGLTLPDLLAAKERAMTEGGYLKDKSVVFVFMHGGPPQTETFDPKMTAPSGIRSAIGEIKTSIPGITFGSAFPKLAQRAHKMAVVRSFHTGDQIHDIKPIVGKETLQANLGSLYSRVAGTNRPHTGIPTNVALFPKAVDPDALSAVRLFGDFDSSGQLGNAYAPFVAGSGGAVQQDMQLEIAQQRLHDRRQLLGNLDQLRRQFEYSSGAQGLNQFQQQAFETILGGAAKAFDLTQESPKTIARYDTRGLVPLASIDQKWNNHERYRDHVQTLGHLMLMARRLCEAGSGFVTVTTNFVWDMHADLNNATVEEGMYYCATPFDHAIAAFLDDVEERGLSEKILLVCCGEMGRTPRINKNGGRDHWGDLAPLMIAGGGLKMGQVIGSSNKDASEPSSTPISQRDLIATIMHTLLDTGKVRTQSGIPRDVLNAVTGGNPIEALI